MIMLDGSGLKVSFGARRVLHGIDVGVAAGEVLGLIGPNAAGKTTAVRALAGLAPLESGTVRLGGRPLAEMARAEVARTLAYLAQSEEVHWPLTAERLVALGRLPHLSPWQRPAAGDKDAVARAMAAADVGHLADRPVTALSGGERARVMLARALATAPRVLLADEPVARLDPFHQIRVMELMRALAAEGSGVIVVLHDLALASRFCDRLVLMSDGRAAATGAPADVLSAETLRRVYGVTALIDRREGELFVVPWRRAADGGGEAAP